VVSTVHRFRWLLAALLAPVPVAPAQPVSGAESIGTGVRGSAAQGYDRGSGVDDGAGTQDAALARRLMAAGRIVPLARVVDAARALRPGTLVGALLHRERHHHGYVYEVQILDAAGVVWELEFDAGSGQLIENEREDH